MNIFSLLVSLVVHLLSSQLSLVLGLLAVNEIKTLGLEKLISLSSSETSKEFLGEGMALGLTLTGFLGLVGPHGSETSGSTNEFVGPASLVLFRPLVDLLVVLRELFEETHG